MLVVVGLVTYPLVFIFGIIALRRRRRRLDGAGVQRAGVGRRRATTPPSAAASPTRWSSRSSPPSASAVLVYSFSRIMLFLSKTSGPAVFAVVAALLLAVGFVIAFVPTLKSGADRRASP